MSAAEVLGEVASSAALAVAAAAQPAREVAWSCTYSIEETAADIDRLVARMRDAAEADSKWIRGCRMRSGVEVYADPFRVLLDVGHEDWADFTSIYEAAS